MRFFYFYHMKQLSNFLIPGKHGKPMVTDVVFQENQIPKPIVVFVHGYKGFKDWGAWSSMAAQFAAAGFFFVKFNFSHNGGTPEQPIDFPDLEAFGNNNYSKELDDLGSVLDWLEQEDSVQKEVDLNHIYLIGHSRGGGMVLLKANEDNRVKKVITLASVSDYKSRFPQGTDFEAWKEQGVYYVVNGRTQQEMPHYFQFYEDFVQNEGRLTIEKATRNLAIPHLIIHGNQDTSVSIQEAENLKRWNPNATYEVIEGADHVFNVKHPWTEDDLSAEMQFMVDRSIAFLKE